jgi:magnesium-transporting ATPase (P-type)
MATQSLRTIAIGYKDMQYSEFKRIVDEIEEEMDNEDEEEESKNQVEKKSDKTMGLLDTDLTLIAIFGIKDPLRPEIKDAVKKCHQAHVNVRMVTGDNIDTAMAIAKECGILNSHDNEKLSKFRCMTGADFRKHFGGLREEIINGEKKEVINDIHAFREIVRELKVLARSTPMDKYILTTGLKNEGNVVAVTGDGTNDAAALKKANVGFAMGKAGTEVAKEAADIILLDDNFGSLVTSIKWGRNVYDSIRKFL